MTEKERYALNTVVSIGLMCNADARCHGNAYQRLAEKTTLEDVINMRKEVTELGAGFSEE